MAWLGMLAAVGGIAFLLLDGPAYFLPSSTPAQTATSTSAPPSASRTVRFDDKQLVAAGVQSSAVLHSPWTEVVRVTGQLGENEDRLAHVHPPSSGVVREVRVSFGDTVKAGDLLAYIDSPAVGNAKLNLVQNRLRLRVAENKAGWQRTIRDNVFEFLKRLPSATNAIELVTEFHDKPMGDFGQQIVAAYTRQRLAESNVQRLSGLVGQNVAGKELLISQAELEAATAAFQSLCEQVKFDAEQQAIGADQQVDDARTGLGVARSELLILGYRLDEVDKMEPLEEGERLAYFPVKAPLDGTIIAKDLVLNEQVTTDFELFRIADLSTIWLRANVFERDIGRLGKLAGKQVPFQATSYPGRTFQATVITMGDIVDDSTRAASLLAKVDNAELLLKPGMFVEVELQRTDDSNILQVADSALAWQGEQAFVFCPTGPQTFERRDVVIGRRNKDFAEIKSGLDVQDKVVTEGVFALKSALFKELLVAD